MAGDDGSLSSIAAQDGTLETLQGSFDYAFGEGEMTVVGSDVTLPKNVALADQLTIGKFPLTSDNQKLF